jgi:hypothetical protein
MANPAEQMGNPAPQEAPKLVEKAKIEMPVPRAYEDEPPVDVKQLFREDAAKVEGIREQINIPAPSQKLSETDLVDIGGVEYLNALPGGEEVKGSTHEGTSDESVTLRQTAEQNPIVDQKAIDYGELQSGMAEMKEISSDNLVETQDELPTLVQEKGKLPRFEAVSESEFPTLTQMPEAGSQLNKPQELTAEDMVVEEPDIAA